MFQDDYVIERFAPVFLRVKENSGGQTDDVMFSNWYQRKDTTDRILSSWSMNLEGKIPSVQNPSI